MVAHHASDPRPSTITQTRTRDPWRNLVLPAIKRVGAAEIARLSGLNRRTVERLIVGSVPTAETGQRILASLAKVIEPVIGLKAPVDQVIVEYLEQARQRSCETCGASVENRRRDTRFCTDRCRMQAGRNASRR